MSDKADKRLIAVLVVVGIVMVPIWPIVSWLCAVAVPKAPRSSMILAERAAIAASRVSKLPT